jgi:Scaffold protein Nfu/NifU N terminal
MATATPSATPNPDAMKFTLDVRLPEMVNVTSAADADTVPLAVTIFAAPGVASLFGVNDFITVTRMPGAAWDPIVEAVQAAAKEL